MADRFDDATQVRVSHYCLFWLRFSQRQILEHYIEGAAGIPRAGAGTGARPAVDSHIHEHVLGQVRFPFLFKLPLLNCKLRFRCITGTPSTRFSRGEESCLANCVERFLDTSLFMVKKIESQRQEA